MAAYDMSNLNSTMNPGAGYSTQPHSWQQSNLLTPLETPVQNNPALRGKPSQPVTYSPGVYNTPPAYANPIPPVYASPAVSNALATGNAASNVASNIMNVANQPALLNQTPRYNGGAVMGMIPGSSVGGSSALTAALANPNNPVLNQSGAGGSNMLRTYLNALMQMGQG